MKNYKYRTITFWGLTYILSWACWFVSAYLSQKPETGDSYTLFMALGLFAPAIVGIILVLTSGDKELKKDYVRKIFDIKRIRPLSVLWMVLAVFISIIVSILISLLFGEGIEQFSFAEGFSFSVGAIPTLSVLLLAAFIEELAWRGYGFECFTSRHNNYKATWIFAVVWSLWHLPLFLIVGGYQYEVLQANILYAVNFIVSGIPITFLFTWLCVKNNRSVFACFLFHFLMNFMQETINMTQVTKCIETVVIAVAAIIIVLLNKKLFFNQNRLTNDIKV